MDEKTLEAVRSGYGNQSANMILTLWRLGGLTSNIA